MAKGLRIKLSQPQTTALRLIRDGQGERAATNTLNSLRYKGLVNREVPIELTEAGKRELEKVENAVALAGQIIAAAPGLELKHYTTSTGTGRLCGAPQSSTGTVVVGDVTCPACKAELVPPPPLACARCGSTERVELFVVPAGEDWHELDNLHLCDACFKAGPVTCKEVTRPTAPNRSFKVEVIADSSGQWVANAIRLGTKEEAEAYGWDLFQRWMLVREKRVVESTDPVNYRWDFSTGLVGIPRCATCNRPIKPLHPTEAPDVWVHDSRIAPTEYAGTAMDHDAVAARS